MKLDKRKKIEKAGWKVGSADEFLGLTKEESAYIEMKLSLSDALKNERIKRQISQVELAKQVDVGDFVGFQHRGVTSCWSSLQSS